MFNTAQVVENCLAYLCVLLFSSSYEILGLSSSHLIVPVLFLFVGEAHITYLVNDFLLFVGFHNRKLHFFCRINHIIASELTFLSRTATFYL